MKPPVGAFPPDADCDRLQALGFEPVADDHSIEYVRFPYALGRTGIVYASQLPLAWGVYWRGPARDHSIAWCRSLDVALELLILVQ